MAVSERLIRVMMYEEYDEYRFWWLPPDIIGFTRQLGLGMRTCLGSTQNVHKAMDVLGIIDSTRFEVLDVAWRC